MRLKIAYLCLIVGLVVVAGAFEVMAKDPIFVRWMVTEDPGDRAILDYWERAEREELTPEELVDLGTMLFHRGFSDDAIDYFERAVDADPNLIEGWFRIGLVEQKQLQFRRARNAYEKCLKLSSGHGWCNFYMGILLEKSGDANAAVDHFRTAFRHAPELTRPDINPEILYSELALAAMLHRSEEQRFHDAAPMPLLQPAKVRKAGGFPEPSTPVVDAGAVVAQPSAAATDDTAPEDAGKGKTAASKDATSSAQAAPTQRRGRTTPSRGPARTPIPDDTPYGTPLGRTTTTERPGGRYSPRISDVSPEAYFDPVQCCPPGLPCASLPAGHALS